jgi:hypothetical protein
MQASRVFAAMIFVLSSVLTASGAEPQEMREIYRTSDNSGRERVYRVAESKLLETKKWSPESEPPPLSVPAAVAVALKRLNSKKPTGLRVIGIELNASGGQEWRWFYRVELYDVSKANGPQPPETLEVVVLMDGSVVEPATPRSSP